MMRFDTAVAANSALEATLVERSHSEALAAIAFNDMMRFDSAVAVNSALEAKLAAITGVGITPDDSVTKAFNDMMCSSAVADLNLALEAKLAAINGVGFTPDSLVTLTPGDIDETGAPDNGDQSEN